LLGSMVCRFSGPGQGGLRCIDEGLFARLAAPKRGGGGAERKASTKICSRRGADWFRRRNRAGPRRIRSRAREVKLFANSVGILVKSGREREGRKERFGAFVGDVLRWQQTLNFQPLRGKRKYRCLRAMRNSRLLNEMVRIRSACQELHRSCDVLQQGGGGAPWPRYFFEVHCRKKEGKKKKIPRPYSLHGGRKKGEQWR